MSYAFPGGGPEVEPQKLFVEAGYGNDPAYLGAGWSEERRVYFTGVHYLGADPNSGIVRLARTASKYNDTQHLRSIGLIQGTLADLNVGEGEVDELYLANVISETRIEQDIFQNNIEPFDLLTRKIRTYTTEEVQDIYDRFYYPIAEDDPRRPLSVFLDQLRRAKAMLKPEGQLTVVETNTPTNPDLMGVIMDNLGFEIEQIVTEEDGQTWRDLNSRYHIQEGDDTDEMPYILIARPRITSEI